MLNIHDLKNRIKSIQDTRQITKAMELISISKMRKAMERYENNLVYFNKVRQTIKDILTHSVDVHHPFLEHRAGNRTTYIVIASDKGLAGSYNKSILELAWNEMKDVKEKYVITIGHKAREFCSQKNIDIDVEFLHTIQNPTLEDARKIAFDIISLYKENLLDEVVVFYTELKNTFTQKPAKIKLLPVELDQFEDVKLDFEYRSEINYDPSPNAVLDVLVPQYVVGLLYAMLIQSSASEHCARMLSMGSANKNADEMLDTLQQDYNRARQANITNSIIEIASGALYE